MLYLCDQRLTDLLRTQAPATAHIGTSLLAGRNKQTLVSTNIVNANVSGNRLLQNRLFWTDLRCMCCIIDKAMFISIYLTAFCCGLARMFVEQFIVCDIGIALSSVDWMDIIARLSLSLHCCHLTHRCVWSSYFLELTAQNVTKFIIVLFIHFIQRIYKIYKECKSLYGSER